MNCAKLMALAGIAFLTATPIFGKTTKDKQTFSGRIEFSGEFTLFLFPESPSRARECVSGAFPIRKHLRVKQKYSGTLVTIRGRLVPYASLAERVGVTERGWKGTPIPNYCGGESVILGEDIRPAGQKAHVRR
jgi:hypothetical protein